MNRVIRPYTRQGSDEVIGYNAWCPGCEEYHTIPVGPGSGPRWQFSGDLQRPTLSPSILVRTGHYAPGHDPEKGCWCGHEEEWGYRCTICHSYIRDGQWQFLSDCTHALAGQTVPLRTEE